VDVDAFVEMDVEDEFALLEEEIAADEVESASKHRQSIFWSPSAITVITREDIRMSGAVNIPDLLRRVPGFDIYEMKPSFPIVGARALTDHSNNLVLVLVDGREALVELSGWPIWAAFTFDIEEIERIEVIRGPGSTLYGANALAGVVNITTVSDRPAVGGDVYLSAGEQGLHRLFGRARGSWSLAAGTLDFSASLVHAGRLSPTDRDNQIFYANFTSHGYVRYRKGKTLDLSLHLGILDGGGPIYMMVGDFRAFNVMSHFEMAKAEIELVENLRLSAQVYHTRFVGDFHFLATVQSLGFWLCNVPDFHMDVSTADAQLQLDYQILEDLLLTAGGNLRYTFNESDKIIPKEIVELRGAGFLHVQWMPLEELQLTGGIRYDLNSETEGALSPRVVAVLRPWPDHAFRLGYGLAFRKPSFTESRMHVEIDEAAFPEVVEKLTTSIGNEDLVNEKVHSIEAGWQARFFDKVLSVSVDLFYNIYQDMIFFESELVWDALGRPDILDSTFHNENQKTSITAYGGEMAVVFEAAKEWTLWGNLGLRWVEDEESGPLPSEPTLRANLGCRWNGQRVFADLALHYVSAYEFPLLFPEETFEVTAYDQLGDQWLVVSRVGYRHPLGESRKLEAGISIRAPIGAPFREYSGLQIDRTPQSVYGSDYVGEPIVRLLFLYLRGSF
jgi:iron complex outermembrane receptor protein